MVGKEREWKWTKSYMRERLGKKEVNRKKGRHRTPFSPIPSLINSDRSTRRKNIHPLIIIIIKRGK